MFEQERKTQYLQTPALERRTKRVIPGFRPVRSLLDAVGPSLLSATDLASRYGIEGEICRPLNHMWQIPRLLTAPNRPCQYNVRIRWLIYSREKSFYLSYGKHWSHRLQSVRMRPAKGNIHTVISFISSWIFEYRYCLIYIIIPFLWQENYSEMKVQLCREFSMIKTCSEIQNLS